MPDLAAGSITLRMTWPLVAPSPYPASIKDRGTAASASTLRDETVGRIMSPTTRAAEPPLKIWVLGQMDWSNGVTNVSAKYPYTMVGTPASRSMASRIPAAHHRCAYSWR